MAYLDKEVQRIALADTWRVLNEESAELLLHYRRDRTIADIRRHLFKHLESVINAPDGALAGKVAGRPDSLVDVVSLAKGGYGLALGQTMKAFALLYYAPQHSVRQFAESYRVGNTTRVVRDPYKKVERLLSLNGRRSKIQADSFKELWRLAVPELFKRELERTNVSIDAFCMQDMVGPGAFTTLLARLKCEQTWDQPFDTGRRLRFQKGDARSKLLDRLKDWVMDDGVQPLIYNIVDPDQPKGLSALGQEFTRAFTAAVERNSQTTETRRPLYLPLMGDLRPDSPAESLKPMGMSQLLGYLQAFYSGGLGTVRDAEPLPHTAPMADVIQNLRKHMTEQPQILILDGLCQHRPLDKSGQSASLLERVIADKHVLRLLSQLVAPPMGAFETQDDWERWSRNRILVLSDFPLEEIGDTGRYIPPSQFKHIEKKDLPGESLPYEGLPQPASSDWPFIVRSHGLQNHSAIAKFSDVTSNIFRDADYAVLDAIIALQERDDFKLRRLIEATVQEKGSDRTGHLLDALFRDLATSNKLAARIVFLIAQSPDGMHRKTLFRIMWQMLESASPDALFTAQDAANWAVAKAYPEDEADRDVEPYPKDEADRKEVFRKQFQEALAFILTQMPAVIYEGYQDDLFETPLHKHDRPQGPHPSELTREGWCPDLEVEMGGALRSGSLTFTLPLFHRIARDKLDEQVTVAQYCYANRMLADEAFWQAGAVFRHEDLASAKSIRPWRRFLSGIYFGLLSLPVVGSEELDVLTISKIKPDGSPTVDLRDTAKVGPKGAWEYWAWLYFFCHLQVFEAPPLFRLSRRFGYESLKSEILQLFEAPNLLWSRARLNKLDRTIRIYSEGLFAPDSPVLNGLYKKDSVEVSPESEVWPQDSDIAAVLRRQVTQAKFLTNSYMEKQRHANDTLQSARITSTQKSLAETVSPLGDATQHRLKMEALRTSLCALRDLPGPHPDPRSTEEVLEFAIEDAVDLANLRDLMTADATACMALTKPGSSDKNLPDLSEQLIEVLPDTKLMSLSKVNCLAEASRVLRRVGEYTFLLASVLRDDDSGQFFSDMSLEKPTELRETDLGQIHRLPFSEVIVGTKTNFLILQYSALAYQRLAEALRLAVFDAAPLSPAYLAEGRGARNHCRTLFLLHSQFVANGGAVTRSPFLVETRALIDNTSRHVYAFPAERAAMLILESNFLRIAVEGVHRLEALNFATAHLAHAESLILEQGRDYKSRWPLHLERARLLRERAEVTKDSQKAKWLRDLSNTDLEWLSKIVAAQEPVNGMYQSTLPLQDTKDAKHSDKPNLFALLLRREYAASK
ncbi:hypothetical protein [uncultured Sulfitobacter sp.]|uniref:hypothetical protein n=1 Tax=uncultured Sulfitobacter sp. TaxID=191468 RepID=UPI00262B1A14|nr:hypothetical protein [uncultured Sulfitobacter sp.]